MRALLFLFVLANAGCLRKTEFQCSDDGSCGVAGKCETTGFCSFLDPDCASGRSYDQSAGSLAGQCTGGGSTGDGGIVDTPSNPGDDGSMPDGSPPAGCPSGYAALTGGQAGHVYKVLPTSENWSTQEAGCQATTLKAHLAVPDDQTELNALDTAAGSNYWLGITDAAQEGVWRTVLGTAQTFLPWQPPAPDNAGAGQGEDCVEGLPPTHTINDRRCMDKLPAVCECVP
jgi:hypothetical protein